AANNSSGEAVARRKLLTTSKDEAVRLLGGILPLFGGPAVANQWISVVTFDAQGQMMIVFDDKPGPRAVGHSGLLARSIYEPKNLFRLDWMRLDAHYYNHGADSLLTAVDIYAPVLPEVVKDITPQLREIKFPGVSDADLPAAYERACRDDGIRLARILMASLGRAPEAVRVGLSGNIAHYFPGVKTLAALALQKMVAELEGGSPMSDGSRQAVKKLFDEFKEMESDLLRPYRSNDTPEQLAFFNEFRTPLGLMAMSIYLRNRYATWQDWEQLSRFLDTVGKYDPSTDIADALAGLKEGIIRSESIAVLEGQIQAGGHQASAELRSELYQNRFIVNGHLTVQLAGAFYQLRQEYLRISPLLWQALSLDFAAGTTTPASLFPVKELREKLVQLAGQRKTFSVRFTGGQYELVVYAEPLRLNDDDLGSDRLDRGNAVRSGEDSLWSNVHVYLDIIKKLGLLRGGAKRVLDVGPGDSLMEAESVLNNIPDVSMVEVYEPDLKNILSHVDVLERMPPEERAKITLVRRSILQLEPGAGPYALVLGRMVLNSDILSDTEIREAWQRIAAVLEPGGVLLGPETDSSIHIDEQVWDSDKGSYGINVYVRRGVPPADKAADPAIAHPDRAANDPSGKEEMTAGVRRETIERLFIELEQIHASFDNERTALGASNRMR
ncbi:MAG: class I SAM-dependent methyltransferase, partial [Candidatus Omnitrophica bacterium]|nr:class I SAM-dependent methyltransferase [Candidatus Omnitrophota bacterium]